MACKGKSQRDRLRGHFADAGVAATHDVRKTYEQSLTGQNSYEVDELRRVSSYHANAAS